MTVFTVGVLALQQIWFGDAVRFISRYMGARDYSVYDTVTKCEWRATYETVNEMLEKGQLTTSPVGPIVAPYQPPETLTKLQVKLKALYGVDTTVFKDMLTSVRFSDSCSEEASIRVSDLASICADQLFWGSPLSRSPKLRLIFDDKVRSIAPFALQPLQAGIYSTPADAGILIDITEVTDECFVREVWKSIQKKVGCARSRRQLFFEELHPLVIDNDERKDRLMRKAYKEWR